MVIVSEKAILFKVMQRSVPSSSYLFEVYEDHADFSLSRTRTTFSALTTWLHVTIKFSSFHPAYIYEAPVLGRECVPLKYV